jgi:hypothetical protein
MSTAAAARGIISSVFYFSLLEPGGKHSLEEFDLTADIISRNR